MIGRRQCGDGIACPGLQGVRGGLAPPLSPPRRNRRPGRYLSHPVPALRGGGGTGSPESEVFWVQWLDPSLASRPLALINPPRTRRSVVRTQYAGTASWSWGVPTPSVPRPWRVQLGGGVCWRRGLSNHFRGGWRHLLFWTTKSDCLSLSPGFEGPWLPGQTAPLIAALGHGRVSRDGGRPIVLGATTHARADLCG